MKNSTYTEPSGMNSFWLGFAAGVLFPALFFLLYFLFRFHDLAFDSYLQFLTRSGKIVHVISLAVFPNLIPFMFFVRTNRFKSGRGVMGATILFAISIFVLKIVL